MGACIGKSDGKKIEKGKTPIERPKEVDRATGAGLGTNPNVGVEVPQVRVQENEKKVTFDENKGHVEEVKPQPEQFVPP